ncbi:MAG TPA: VWA domain-containing protein [Candidatus Binatia bacterium]|nr:VWA domain-containing protein [Candidatus Binatia bacterium]
MSPSRVFGRRPVLALSVLLISLSLFSQDTSTPTISREVKVVNVLATVRDKKGSIVNNLSKDDFRLTQDGRPQIIHYFTRESDLPLTLGLLVDTSMSQRRLIDAERTGSYAFLNEFMRVDKDKAFIIHFDWDVELLQDLTGDHQKLQAALDKLGAPHFDNSGGGSPGGGGGYPRGGGPQHHAGGTTLYDAVFLASDELMPKQQGRKALILLTDGVDTGSKVSLNRAIETAQRANTLVYSILYSDPDAYGHQYGPRGGMGGGMGRHGGWPGGGGYPGGGGGYPPQQRQEHPDGKKVLQRMSRETGGRFFEVSKKESINQIYDQIADELRNQYNIGYTPEKAVAGVGYHAINLTTTNKDLSVQAREGYYAEQ